MRLGGGGSGSDATASRATDPDVLLSQSNGSAPLPHEKDSRTMRPGSSSGGGGSPARIPKDSGSVVAPSTTLAIPNTQSGTNLTNLQDAAIETEQVQQSEGPAGAAVGNHIEENDQNIGMPEDPDGSAEGSQIDKIDQNNLILANPDVLSHRANLGDNAIEEEEHQQPRTVSPASKRIGVALAGSALWTGWTLTHTFIGLTSKWAGPTPRAPVTSHLRLPVLSTTSLCLRINENDIIRCVTENRWDDIEEHLVEIIDTPEPLNLHPVLFLHVRRSKLLDLVETKRFDDAAAYFTSNIKGPFDQVWNLGEENLTFATVNYLKGEIGYCASCVNAKARIPHPHGNPVILHHIIFDYFRLNIPSKIRYKEPPTNHKMWRFGIRVETPVGNSKASYRCMACQHVFNQESIGRLESHLRKCFMMETPHLQQLFEASRSTAQIQKVARVRSRSQPLIQQNTVTSAQPQTEALASLSTTECMRLYKENLGIARLVQGKLAEGSQDGAWPTILGTALDNIEAYGNMLMFRMGQATSISQTLKLNEGAPPLATTSNTGHPLQACTNNLHGSANAISGPTVQRLPSAQPVELDAQLTPSGQATSISQTLMLNEGAPPLATTSNPGHPLEACTNNLHGSGAVIESETEVTDNTSLYI